MSHPGNWSDRKLDLEIARAKWREREDAARKNIAWITPEETYALGWSGLTVSCLQCRSLRVVSRLPERLRQRTWIELAVKMRCKKCGSPPDALSFSTPADLGGSRSVAKLNLPPCSRGGRG